MRTPIMVDGRNLYDPRDLTALGFTYRGVGLPATVEANTAARDLAAPAVTIAIGR